LNKFLYGLLFISVVIFGGCASAARFTAIPVASPSTTAQPVHSLGSALLTVEGVASYYGDQFDKKKTSSGDTFDKNAMTAAHREFPFGTVLRVTNLSNDKSVEVTVNDRGPFDKSRILDLSEGAAKVLDMLQSGTARVRIEVLKWGGQ